MKMETSKIILLIATALTVFVLNSVQGQQGTCGGDCIWSEDCALDASDITCRCSYFHCRKIDAGTCGGGCFDNFQCSRWAGGDENCVCGTLFECINRSEMEKPGYETYAKFLASARGTTLRRKIDKMMELRNLKMLTENKE